MCYFVISTVPTDGMLGYPYALWPLLLTWINLIPSWIRNYTQYNAWGEITYPFLNFKGSTVEV